ncbi:C1q domain-containing protein [Ulvibacter sp. MAR_2010_11]|nr:C1q domain-containing protein [Ulvibacter sp. MAR_2010_11]
MFFSTATFSQVGIGTTFPSASLDINGNLKIRLIPEEALVNDVKDSVLVVNGNYVKSIPTKSLVTAALPTTIKGTFSTTGAVNLSLLSGVQTIPFNDLHFDVNNEFNTTTYMFTAKQDGIYAVNVHIEAGSSIGIATNFGVRILKNGTVESRNSFANVGVLGVNVTPPVRSSQTLLQLSTNDTISFQIEGDIALGSVNLLGADQDSYFTIHQVR